MRAAAAPAQAVSARFPPAIGHRLYAAYTARRGGASDNRDDK